MTAEDAAHAIQLLKDMCDPRGHELLDAIGAALITQSVAVDRLDQVIGALYKEQFSRKVGLRSVKS